MLRRVKGFTLIELLIVVAIIAILAAIAIPNFLEAQTRSKVSRVKSDQRTLGTALESYYIDNNAYPAQCSAAGDWPNANSFAFQMGSSSIGQAKLAEGAPLRLMPTFRVKASLEDPLMTLTTPVAYLSSYISDPFADTKGAIFAYSTPNPTSPPGYGIGWIIWSYGPNTDENKPWGENGNGGEIECRKPLDDMGYPFVNETYFNPEKGVPSETLLLHTYDPSNGTTSNGDVWRTSK